jgi:uncharacterized membrane protein (UPF0136 family)
LLSHRPGARHAQVAIAVSILSTVGLLLALSGRSSAEWVPSLVGILLGGLVFATAWLQARPMAPGPRRAH